MKGLWEITEQFSLCVMYMSDFPDLQVYIVHFAQTELNKAGYAFQNNTPTLCHKHQWCSII